jgi:serine/threonine-protein kinase
VFVLIALAFALGIGTWYTVLGPGADVATPSLVGQTLEEAKNEIDLSGLTLAQSSSQFSEDIPAGRIIKSSPSGGVQVAKGSEVKIIVSKGPERFTVPTLTGLSLTEATSLLSDNNLKISTLATQYDEKVPLGYIVSSSPSYGTKLKRNSVVGVIVSKGIEEVAIESFVGKLSDQALSQLKESGFTVVIQSDYSNSISAGRVISQVPSTGKLAKGSKVALVVSKGPNLITVPNVVKNLTGAQAGKILEDLGLTFKPNVLKKNGPGKVIGQSIKAGTKVKPGTLVLLDIY